ncbi:MAG: EAL domain-containing protein [Treponema sp.]|nr:EAL domain-containing protein [Treponema sp.]
MESSVSAMVYNVNFDIAAIINLLIVLFAFFIHKKLPEQKNRMFLYLCVSTLCSVLVDVCSALELSGFIHVSIEVLWGMNTLYFLCVCSIPFFFSLYAFALIEEYELLQKNTWKILVYAPVLIELLAIIVTPGYHFIFDITANGEYIRRNGVFLLYFLMTYQILIAVFVVVKFRAKTSMQDKIYIFSFIGITLCGIVIQFVFPKLLMQHFAISASLLMIFTSLQINEVITHPITGLLNQKAFNLLMEINFKKKSRFTIIALHLDDVPFLHTTFGTEGVSVLLVQITEYLKASFPNYQLFTLENDLFAIVVPDTDSVVFSRITANIRKQFGKSWKSSVIDVKTSVRQCVMRFPKDANSIQTIRDTLDALVTDSRYKNEKLLFAEDIDISARRRYSYVEQLVKTAISENRIQVMYQPLFSISENRIIGAEALVRMKDREGNYIFPDEFIPIAEQDGTILRIGEFVFEDVCRFLATHRMKDLGVKMIDVNLSVAQCMQTVITETFEGILKYYRLDPSILNLEITETASAHTPELLYSNMEKFKSLGFMCSLDDYGTGNANISYMLHMPFSMIKIDKEIIWTAMEDPRAHVMLVGIMDMLHKLNMKICAEGIETQEMVNMLTRLGCDYLQGYFYSKPIPEDEFFELFLKQTSENVMNNIVEEISEEDDDFGELEEIEELEPVEE